MAEQNSIDDFLNHKSSSRGGSFLKSWKDDGSVVVWLHTKHVPKALYQHALPKVVAKEDNNGVTRREVWGGKYVCHEREDVLREQYKRTTEGQREFPPKRCPLCRMIEWVRLMVEGGRMSWCRQVFRFDCDDPKKTRILHAGGLYNAFGSRDLTEEQTKEMAKHGIYPKTAWQENAMAKLNYLFVIVNADDPQAGVLIATETGLLGDKTKDVIRKSMNPRVLGPTKGNPMVSPYPICWVFDDKKKKFDEKYDAFRVEEPKLTPAVEKMLRGPAQDVKGIIAPFDKASMRATLERHCLLPKDKVPWDSFFADAEPEEEFGETPAPEERSGRTPEVGDSFGTEHDSHEEAEERQKDGEPEMLACDKCEKPMPASASECPHCGEKYDVEAEAPAPPPATKPLPKRSAVAGAKKARPVPAEQGSLPDGECGGGDDDIPF